jgi:hypothetical protein
LVAPAGAFAKPNFSGNWTFNASKSDFGPMPTPEKWERKITHEDPSLQYSQVQAGPQGEMKSEMAYTTDGKPATNKTPRGEVTGVAKWDGDVLTISSKREIQGMEITQNERWTLSEDGKTLTILNKVNTPQGDFELKIVMDKQ